MPSPTQNLAFFRTAARYLTEPHPSARNPVTMAPHPVPWGVYATRLTRTSKLYALLPPIPPFFFPSQCI